ncbi:Hypothetical predicted protein, partial [Mytilus galloprovincialis]
YFVDTPPEEITVVEGQSVFLKYELLTNCSMVIYKRNDIIIGNTSNIRVTESRRLKTLKIKDITQKEEGQYCLEAAGMTSKPTMVIVKPMFKQPLQNKTSVEGSNTTFECETEKENSDSEWFKDGVKMVDGNKKIKMETVLGHTFKLTIKCISLLDNGKYSIRVNGILSEAELDVKCNQLEILF